METTIFHTIIIGGGAGGLYAGMELSRKGIPILILEKEPQLACKVMISGGGKCNFTNRSISHENYVSQNPSFVKSALARFSPEHFLEFLSKHKITWEERENGRLFTLQGSKYIILALEKDILNYHGSILKQSHVLNIEVSPTTSYKRFKVILGNKFFESKNVILATGGLSTIRYTSDFAYQIAKKFQLVTIPVEPGLVPLHMSHSRYHGWEELSGISFPIEVQCKKKFFSENILFTHEGLSGPSILQASLYWQSNSPLYINLLPHLNFENIIAQNRTEKIELKNLLARYLPKRFADKFCEWEVHSKPIRQYHEKELSQLAHCIHHWNIYPSQKSSFASAETTLGGISTQELSSKTMECKKIPGLYCIGEAIDVAGELGGYNLHWAWASGHAVASAIQESDP